MGSTFNPLILVDKLAKLNSSQQSIETLSHWCIFHMNKAKQVVETWDRQYHCSPREQRLAFLYLANDILQNSRRKGVEFVAEFWKVLPGSLRDVIENGDEFGRNAAFRLISIWEERKVFGSRGHILKEEFMKRQSDNDNRNCKHVGFNQKPPSGSTLDKLVSGYQAVYGIEQEEDTIFYKCGNAIEFVEKVDKDIEGDYNIGHINGSITDELKGQNAILKDCIEQLKVIESSRGNLVSLLQESLREQEDKLDQVRSQLQAAQMHSEQAGSICRQLLGGNGNGNGNGLIQPVQSGIRSPATQVRQNLMPGAREQSISAIHTRPVSFAEKSGHIEENPKSAAAAMAAHLTASSSSAQMLTYAISEVIGNPINELSSDYPSEKRAKIESDHPSYVPQYPQAPVPAFSHPEQLQHSLPVTSQELNSAEPPPPPPPSSPPPLPPLPPPMQLYPEPQFMHASLPIPNGPFGYNMSQQLPGPLPNYTSVVPQMNGVSAFAPPPNAYPSYQAESGFYVQPSSLPMAPMGRQ